MPECESNSGREGGVRRGLWAPKSTDRVEKRPVRVRASTGRSGVVDYLYINGDRKLRHARLSLSSTVTGSPGTLATASAIQQFELFSTVLE
jgi:hypothetical protein